MVLTCFNSFNSHFLGLSSNILSFQWLSVSVILDPRHCLWGPSRISRGRLDPWVGLREKKKLGNKSGQLATVGNNKNKFKQVWFIESFITSANLGNLIHKESSSSKSLEQLGSSHCFQHPCKTARTMAIKHEYGKSFIDDFLCCNYIVEFFSMLF